MKRTYVFATKVGATKHALRDGSIIEIPIFPGILKHPSEDQLFRLLKNPEVLSKYTVEALRKAAWPILNQFPPSWLKEHMQKAQIRPGSLEALRFLL